MNNTTHFILYYILLWALGIWGYVVIWQNGWGWFAIIIFILGIIFYITTRPPPTKTPFDFILVCSASLWCGVIYLLVYQVEKIVEVLV